MVCATVSGLLTALILSTASVDLPGPGGTFGWQDAAAPNVLDSDGQPPILVPVFSSYTQTALWFWPRRQLSFVCTETSDAAWDAAGPHALVALVDRSSSERPANGRPPPDFLVVVRCDWRGNARVLAGPMEATPVALAWIARRGAALAGVNRYGYARSAVHRSVRHRGVACDLLLVGAKGLRTVASSPGLYSLADAGDGHHAFAIEMLALETKSAAGTAIYMTRCLTSLDLDTGARRILVRRIDDHYLYVHGGRAVVIAEGPPPEEGKERTEWMNRQARGQILSVGLDGSARVLLDRDPPRYIDSLAVGESGLLLVVRRCKAGGSPSQNRALAALDWHGHTTVPARVEPGTMGGIKGLAVLSGGSALFVQEAMRPDPPRVWISRPPNLTLLVRPDDPLASARQPARLDVPGVGQVAARLIGRIPISDVRPWMIVAVDDGGQFSPARNWSPGKPLKVALVYPMRVGSRTFMFCDGRTLPSPEDLAELRAWSRPHDLVLAFQPVEPIDLRKLHR